MVKGVGGSVDRTVEQVVLGEEGSQEREAYAFKGGEGLGEKQWSVLEGQELLEGG
jgi:hypothetical protein